jgi:hypothetical protein
MELKEVDWVDGIKNINTSVKKYAQFGEEPIFDYIFENIGTTNKYLVDFGASSLNSGLSNSKYLLDNGADLQAKNNLGISAIDIADIYEKPWIGDGLRARWVKLYKKPYTSSAKPKSPTS